MSPGPAHAFDPILPPEAFGLVHHRALNRGFPAGELARLLDATSDAGRLFPHRTPVAVLEGDLLQTVDSGRVIFTHLNLSAPTEAQAQELMAAGVASDAVETLEALEPHRDDVVLCLELKGGTRPDAVATALTHVQRLGFSRVYLDSFFPTPLRLAQSAARSLDLPVGTSLHVAGAFRHLAFSQGGLQGFDLHTVPWPTQLGDGGAPVIHGAVWRSDQLQRLAARPHVRGAYARLSDAGILKMALSSVRNTVSGGRKSKD